MRNSRNPLHAGQGLRDTYRPCMCWYRWHYLQGLLKHHLARRPLPVLVDDDLALVICSFSFSELISAIRTMPLQPFNLDWRWLRGLENSEIPLKMERICCSPPPPQQKPRAIRWNEQKPNRSQMKVWFIP